MDLYPKHPPQVVAVEDIHFHSGEKVVDRMAVILTADGLCIVIRDQSGDVPFWNSVTGKHVQKVKGVPSKRLALRL